MFFVLFCILFIIGIKMVIAGDYIVGFTTFMLASSSLLPNASNRSLESTLEPIDKTKDLSCDCNGVDCSDTKCLSDCDHLFRLGNCDFSS